ncbi:MAG: hypothetical protein P8Y42_01870 [Exilibacterium sp.]
MYTSISLSDSMRLHAKKAGTARRGCRDRLRQGCPKRFAGQALPQASPQGRVYGVSLEGLHLL